MCGVMWLDRRGKVRRDVSFQAENLSEFLHPAESVPPITLSRHIVVFLFNTFETLNSLKLVGSSQFGPQGGVVLHISPHPLLSADDYQKMTSVWRQD